MNADYDQRIIDEITAERDRVLAPVLSPQHGMGTDFRNRLRDAQAAPVADDRCPDCAASFDGVCGECRAEGIALGAGGR